MDHELIDILKNARIASGLRQQEVGLKLGYKANTVSNWESGRTEPGIDTFIKLCKLYNLGLSDLFYQKQNQENNIALSLTPKEQDNISRYRQIDHRGRRNVDDMIEREYQYCLQKEKKK